MLERSRFDARLDLVPESPGVYLMKDASGSVIYVGKAVRLKSRLRNYFTQNPKGTSKILAMIANISDFDFILCSNETEALLLECNLIKQYRPKYNTMLMDDKGYPYIKITYNEEYPRVQKAFRIGSDIREGAKYYGPYMSGSLRKALETLKDFFPVRTCNLKLPEDMNKQRPCLNYHIGKCPAPCNGLISQKDYMKQIDSIRMFLEGKYDDILNVTETLMNESSEHMDYERAVIFRDRLAALRGIMVKQSVEMDRKTDLDVIGFASGDAESCVQKLEIRDGRMVGNATIFSCGADKDDPYELSRMLLMHYGQTAYIPKQIFVPFQLEDMDTFQEAVSDLAGKKISVRTPRRGHGRDLISLAQKNAAQTLRRRESMAKGSSGAKEAVDKLSGIVFKNKDRINRIEAYDISNFGNDDIAGSMVVFENGKSIKSGYRLFKIRGNQIRDDYSSMREVIRRRFTRKDKNFSEKFPELVLIDGSSAHAKAAKEVLDALGYGDIAVLGMAKDKKHRTRALAWPDGKVLELSSQDAHDSADREETLLLLRFITMIQNEAHRFALKYSSKLSQKRNTKFTLESIKGVGPAKRKELMKNFGSLRNVSKAGVEELSKVKGITADIAQEIYDHFHEEKGDSI